MGILNPERRLLLDAGWRNNGAGGGPGGQEAQDGEEEEKGEEQGGGQGLQGREEVRRHGAAVQAEAEHDQLQARGRPGKVVRQLN